MAGTHFFRASDVALYYHWIIQWCYWLKQVTYSVKLFAVFQSFLLTLLVSLTFAVYLRLLKCLNGTVQSLTDLKAKHPFIKQKNDTNSSDVVYGKCYTEFSVTHGGSSDIDKHLESKKHIAFDQAACSSKNLSSFFKSNFLRKKVFIFLLPRVSGSTKLSEKPQFPLQRLCLKGN